jgi:NlpC/P60 family
MTLTSESRSTALSAPGPLCVGKTLQLWQFEGRSLKQACDQALEYGFNGLMVKAFDGDRWMNAFDPSADALGSVEEVAAQRAHCESRGLRYAIWTNPLYGDDDYLNRQAELYASAANAAGVIVWDTEPYLGPPPFWGPNRPVGAAARLMSRFRALAPHAVCLWQPDPRPARLAELRPEEWAPFMQVYSPQVYWSDFKRPPLDVLKEAWDGYLRMQAESGLAPSCEFAPTLPGNASPASIAEGFRWLHTTTVTGVVVWRYGSMAEANLSAVRDGQLYGPQPVPVPQPVPEPVPVDLRKAMVEWARGEIGKRYAGPIVREPDWMRWGDPGYDCSSFAASAYIRIGLELAQPGTAYTDAIWGRCYEVSRDEALPGDPVFYEYNDGVQTCRFPHMGILTGPGMQIDCSITHGVMERPLLQLGTVRFARLPALDAPPKPAPQPDGIIAELAKQLEYKDRLLARACERIGFLTGDFADQLEEANIAKGKRQARVAEGIEALRAHSVEEMPLD